MYKFYSYCTCLLFLQKARKENAKIREQIERQKKQKEREVCYMYMYM